MGSGVTAVTEGSQSCFDSFLSSFFSFFLLFFCFFSLFFFLPASITAIFVYFELILNVKKVTNVRSGMRELLGSFSPTHVVTHT